MQPPKEKCCHRTGFEKSCRELVSSEKCTRWRAIVGAHPQTGALVNHFDCIDDHMFLIALQTGRQQDQVIAGIDKTHNEQDKHHKASEALMGALVGAVSDLPDRIAFSPTPIAIGDASQSQKRLGGPQ